MGKMSVSVYMEGIYEEFYALRAAKKQSQTKPNKANMPAIGRKSEARSPKSDNSGCVAARLLPRVGRETN